MVTLAAGCAAAKEPAAMATGGLGMMMAMTAAGSTLLKGRVEGGHLGRYVLVTQRPFILLLGILRISRGGS